jgi:hypothetical protein
VNDQKDNEELVFSAPATGTMPMDVESCDSIGTYNFTAYVRHRVVLALPAISSLGRRGSLSVSVHNPAGGAVSDPALMVALQVRTRSGWTTIGTAAAANSVAKVTYRVPRALKLGRVKLRAVASGTAYLTQTSATVAARLR